MQFRVPGWAIQDGRPEIAVGDVIEVALTVGWDWQVEAAPLDGPPRYTLRDDGDLDVVGRVVAVAEHGLALDVGLPVAWIDNGSSQAPPRPAWVAPGATFRGSVCLHLDIFDDTAKALGWRTGWDHHRRWRVTRIRSLQSGWRETAGERRGRPCRVLVRVPPLRWVDVEVTDPWNDDEHNAAYRVDAELAPDQRPPGPPDFEGFFRRHAGAASPWLAPAAAAARAGLRVDPTLAPEPLEELARRCRSVCHDEAMVIRGPGSARYLAEIDALDRAVAASPDALGWLWAFELPDERTVRFVEDADGRVLLGGTRGFELVSDDERAQWHDLWQRRGRGER